MRCRSTNLWHLQRSCANHIRKYWMNLECLAWCVIPALTFTNTLHCRVLRWRSQNHIKQALIGKFRNNKGEKTDLHDSDSGLSETIRSVRNRFALFTEKTKILVDAEERQRIWKKRKTFTLKSSTTCLRAMKRFHWCSCSVRRWSNTTIPH